MKSYQGERTFDAVIVTVNGQTLNPRRDLRQYSENHFEWGYEGDESRQLALAILADCLDDDVAVRHAEAFMLHIVANFGNEWEMSDAQVQQAVQDLQVD